MTGKLSLFQIAHAWASQSVAAQLKAPLGGEFQAAFEAAKEVQATVTLGDRPVE